MMPVTMYYEVGLTYTYLRTLFDLSPDAYCGQMLCMHGFKDFIMNDCLYINDSISQKVGVASLNESYLAMYSYSFIQLVDLQAHWVSNYFKIGIRKGKPCIIRIFSYTV